MKASPILVTGTIAFDHLFQYGSVFLDELREATALQTLSVSFHPHQYVKRAGGTGSNIAWNVAMLGDKPLLVANIGPDGQDLKNELSARGIDMRYVQTTADAMTATGICCTDTRGHQIWFFYDGADIADEWPTLDDAPEIAYAIIGARHHPQMLSALRWCSARGIPSLFDPGQQILNFSPEELRLAASLSSGVIMNEFEWGIFSGRAGMDEAALAQTAQYLIVTRGEKGFSVYTKEGSRSYASCVCEKVVDPTGAGDAFRAGLVRGLTHGWQLDDAAKLGSAVASFVVEEQGTHIDTLDTEVLQKRMHTAYGDSLPSLND